MLFLIFLGLHLIVPLPYTSAWENSDKEDIIPTINRGTLELPGSDAASEQPKHHQIPEDAGSLSRENSTSILQYLPTEASHLREETDTSTPYVISDPGLTATVQPVSFEKKQLEIVHDNYKNKKALTQSPGPTLSDNKMDSITNQYRGATSNSSNKLHRTLFNKTINSNWHYNYKGSPLHDYGSLISQRYRTFQPVTYQLIYLQSQHQQRSPQFQLLQQQNNQPFTIVKSPSLQNPSPSMLQYTQQQQLQHPQSQTNSNQVHKDDIFVDGYQFDPQNGNSSSMMLRMYQYGDEHNDDATYDDDEIHDGDQALANSSTKCRYCGGYKAGSYGSCCKYCGMLQFDGCWCKSCDCLCYMMGEKPIRWSGQLRSYI